MKVRVIAYKNSSYHMLDLGLYDIITKQDYEPVFHKVYSMIIDDTIDFIRIIKVKD